MTNSRHAARNEPSGDSNTCGLRGVRYRYPPSQSLEEIEADIRTIEKEILQMLYEVAK
jgi:hypothetical protein